MLGRGLFRASSWHQPSVCLFCAARSQIQPPQFRAFSATPELRKRPTRRKPSRPAKDDAKVNKKTPAKAAVTSKSKKKNQNISFASLIASSDAALPPPQDAQIDPLDASLARRVRMKEKPEVKAKGKDTPKSIKDALIGGEQAPKSIKDALLEGKKTAKQKAREEREKLAISTLYPDDFTFEPIEVEIPPVPMLSYGLDRVLFNPGVYRLQDPRSRVYNFDPYLEKIMPVHEFNFDALSEYKTSSKDTELLALTKRLGTKFTGSTSSMSGVLQHFHYLLSNFRKLNHTMLSREYPDPSGRFSKITLGPSAIFLRQKDGVYAIDADKSFDSPNIMSWLGHSLEKLLTTERSEFERYRRSSPEQAPAEGDSSRCYHYSRQGNLLMRSQLDAYDPRLPGTGIFDLKTRAVVSIRMNHKKYEQGSGYQLRKAQGEWESFEREFYDMTRATLLKYSLQVRMGRMDGIYLAFHNIERIFGFQYLCLPDMDLVLHGQSDTILGDQEFKLSIGLLDELLSRATDQFPNSTLRMHFEAREGKTPFMYIFAEPVTEEQADEIQSAGNTAQQDFARNVVGLGKDDKDDSERQAAWQDIQDQVDEQVDEDNEGSSQSNAIAVDGESEPQQEESVVDRDHEAQQEESVVDSENETQQEEAAVDTENEAQREESVKDIEDGAQQEEASAETSKQDDLTDETAASEPAKPRGPLMGWTLTVRSKVNGGYVDRPERLEQSDEWKIEYHIQEIRDKSRCWKLYEALRERRRNLLGLDEEEVDKGLRHYRDIIQRYSKRGRKWRRKQDELDRGKDVQVYRPLGPGSEALDSTPKVEQKGIYS